MFSFVETCRSGPLTLLLDYDGTLVPIADTPDLATPDADLLELLAALTHRPQRAVHLVSGRARRPLETWFNDLPAALWAEHGFWHRIAPGTPWRAAGAVPSDALRQVRPILDRAAIALPGAFVEEKSASLAWHYRLADEHQAAVFVPDLRHKLDNALHGTSLERLEGNMVIEVRLRGVSKALAARSVGANHAPAGAVLAIGDDITDGELFAALPDSAITIAVGPHPTIAKYQLPDPDAARQLLRALVA